MRTGSGRTRRSIDDLTTEDQFEKPQHLKLVNGYGTTIHVPMQTVSTEHGSTTISDFRQMTDCKRCGGHSGDDGRPHGGLLHELKCIHGTWYPLAAACPECCFGAFWKHFTSRMKFYDQMPKHITHEHIQALSVHMTKGKTLMDMVDEIRHPEIQNALEPIVMEMIQDEQRGF